MADTKTYLKVQWRDTTVRALPFTSAHLTGLTMAQQLPGAAQVRVLFRILFRVLDPETYEGITNDYVDGLVALTDLSDLLNSVVEATHAYAKATGE